MAESSEQTLTAQEISVATGIALPTASKILKRLVKSKVLTSIRGAKGGYRLARAPEKITVAAVINALEGPIALTECSSSKTSCEQAKGCHIQGRWNLINQRIFNALESVTLADMILPPTQPEEHIISINSLYR
jgi:FeS assembly SUF system regulator